MKIALIIIITILVIIAVYLISTYNTLVKLRNRVKDSWSQIEIQLKRRFDLIPNMVETVKAYATHESETLKGVIEARNKFNASTNKNDEINANDMLATACKSVFALSENYPELKANENFQNMQLTIETTENRVTAARQFYNDTVLTFNNKVEIFPANLVAKMFKFEKEEFLTFKEEDKEIPKVKF